MLCIASLGSENDLRNATLNRAAAQSATRPPSLPPKSPRAPRSWPSGRRRLPRAYVYAYFACAIILALYLVVLFSGPDVETTGGLTIQAMGQKIVVYASIICVVIQSWGAYRVERRRLSQR
jgi:hypothetical protein